MNRMDSEVRLELYNKLLSMPADAQCAFFWLVEHLADARTILGEQNTDPSQVLDVCQRLMEEEDYLPAALAALKYAMMMEEGI